MGTWRKWVFPILRLVVFAVIAAALVKLAFFDGRGATDEGPQPTAAISEPVYPVALGTVVNDVTVAATIEADAAEPVKSSAAGTVHALFVDEGAAVARGDALFDVTVETPRDPIEVRGEDGSVTLQEREPSVRYETVTAPADGVLTTLDVLRGQSVAIGDTAGSVSPRSFSVVGAIEPAQQYRLTDRPGEATVAITDGPAPFTCTGLTMGSAAPVAVEGVTPEASAPAGDAGTSVRCRVPAEVSVFPGLAAQITIPAGTAENVLVVPTTAVEGGAGTGVVYLLAEDGSHEPREVTLGLSDGSFVEVTGGLGEGDEILEFSPSAVASEEECMDMGDGSLMCPDGSTIP